MSEEHKLSYRATAKVSNNGKDWQEQIIVYVDYVTGSLTALSIDGIWWNYVKDIKEGGYEI